LGNSFVRRQASSGAFADLETAEMGLSGNLGEVKGILMLALSTLVRFCSALAKDSFGLIEDGVLEPKSRV
jgi:hypothetical protein